jgi:hypothetical protein
MSIKRQKVNEQVKVEITLHFCHDSLQFFNIFRNSYGSMIFLNICRGKKILFSKRMGQSLCFRQIYILSKTLSYINCCQAPLLLSILKFIVNKTQLDIVKNELNVA